MRAWSSGLVAMLLVVVAMRPAAGDACREEDRDMRGNCPAKTNPPPPKPRSNPTRLKPKSCPAGMVRVPAGRFRMGSADPHDAEHPQHVVTLSGYCIDKTEVTVKAFTACVAAGTCSAAKEPGSSGYDQFCNGSRADRADHPVNCVDWNQASVYCAWAGKRLPTEPEWEYAARGGDGRTYPWGNDAPTAKRLNACGTECVAVIEQKLNRSGWSAMYDGSDGWEATSPVGSFPEGASPFGALDMAGNVWEWTADRQGDTPVGLIRGGGWQNDGTGKSVQVTLRSSYVPNKRFSYLGFRCARGD